MPDNNAGLSFTLFRNYIPKAIGMDRCLKASVCIPLIRTSDGWALLLEKRSPRISEQPGDICFPGGMIELGESTVEAVLREVSEELLIEKERIHLLGESDYLYMDNRIIYPFVAELKGYEGTFSTDEVEEVFTLPLSWLREYEPEEYVVKCIVRPEDDFPYDRIEGGRDYKWCERSEVVYFYQYGKYTIWGITARILQSFFEIFEKR